MRIGLATRDEGVHRVTQVMPRWANNVSVPQIEIQQKPCRIEIEFDLFSSLALLRRILGQQCHGINCFEYRIVRLRLKPRTVRASDTHQTILEHFTVFDIHDICACHARQHACGASGI